VDIRGRDLRSAVKDMQQAVAAQVKLPAGYSVSWSGQFEFFDAATAWAGDTSHHAKSLTFYFEMARCWSGRQRRLGLGTRSSLRGTSCRCEFSICFGEGPLI
jgi:hypothetical protein